MSEKLSLVWPLTISIGLVIMPSIVSADVRTDQKVVIGAEEIVDDDLYVFAETVTVDGTINGDLIVFGAEIEINGTIQGDLMAAGQSIALDGRVSDDVRICGQTLKLSENADVGDDLIAAAYSLECEIGSQIAGELKFAGYQAIFAGQVGKDLQSATANCELLGQFGGDVSLTVDGSDTPFPTWFIQTPLPVVPSGLTVTDTATIAGDLDYKAVREATISPDAAIVGNVNFRQTQLGRPEPAVEPPSVKSRVLAAARQFLALLVVGLVVVLVFPGWTRNVSGNIQRRPLACFGWGLISIVGVAASTILLIAGTISIAMTLGIVSLESLLPAWLALGALATAGLVIGFAIFAVWVAKIFVVMWAGNRIVNGAGGKTRHQLLSLIVGLLLFVALCAIPFAGGLVSLIVALLGIGGAAIWLFGGKPGVENIKAKPIPIKSHV